MSLRRCFVETDWFHSWCRHCAVLYLAQRQSIRLMATFTGTETRAAGWYCIHVESGAVSAREQQQ